MKPKIRRKLAAFLAVCMTVSLMPELTWADTGGGGKTVVITEFKPLAEDIAEQEAPPGTRKSELNLPSKLKAVGYEQGAEDENDPPATDSSVKTGEDDTDTTPRALTVTGVKWEADEPYDEMAAGETFTFTAVLPKRYVLEGAELPEIVVTLSEELKNNSKKATDSDATDSDVDLEEFAITKQPHDVYALVGHEVPFTVEATGGEITYQWQKGVPGAEADGTFNRDSAETDAFTWSDIAGADEAEYRFVAEEEDLTRNVYRCVLTCGEEELTTDAAKVKRMMMRGNGNSVQLLDSSDVPKETYATLQAAIDAAKDDYTLKLLADIELGSTGVTIGSEKLTLTLDLGDKEITYAGGGSAITLIGDASLIVTGTTGGISATGTGGTAIYNAGAGNVSIEGGTVSTAAFISYVIHNAGAGRVSVTGGTVSTTGDGGAAIYNAETGIVSVEGGTVSATGERAMAIRNYGKGRVSVEGGTVSATGEEGIAIRNDKTGKITINGNARITSETTPENGGTIYLAEVPGADVNPKIVLEILGGEVENTAAGGDGYAVYFKDGIGVTAENVTDYYSVAAGAEVGRVYSENVAEVLTGGTGTGTPYPTLADAITYAQGGDTIQMLANVDLGTTGVEINNKSLTLDLNGKTVTHSGNSPAIRLSSDASLTVTDSSVNGKGELLATGVNGKAIFNFNKSTGSIAVSGGTVSATGANGTAIYNVSGDSITVSDGTVSATGEAGIAINNFSYGSITVSDGTVSATGEAGIAICNELTGSITVSGGTVSATGADGTAINNLSTGKIIVSGTAKVTSKATGEYGTIYLSAVPKSGSKTVLEIQGGTVENTATTAGYSVYFGRSSGVTAENVTDYYSVAAGAKVGKIYPHPSLNVAEVLTGGTGTGTPYPTLAAAITNAASGDTVKILTNVDLGTDSVMINKSLTLDLNGKTVTYSGDSSAIRLFSDASLTVTDGSGNGEGELLATEANEVAIFNESTGSITVSGGTVSATGANGIAIYNYSGDSITVSGGTVSATEVNGVAICNELTGSIAVSGGTVSATGADGRAIHNNSTGKITVSGTAKVTSKATGEYGTIYLLKVPQSDPKTVLAIQGGEVKNTAADGDGYAVYFKDGIGVTAENVTDYYSVAQGAKVGKIYPQPSLNVAEVLTGGTGTGTPYPTLADAITHAQGGDTIQILTNVDLGTTGVTIGDNKSLTLDLNGKPITYSGSSFAISLSGDASLTVTDSSGNGKGELLATGSNGVAINNYSGDSITVSGGTVSATGDRGIAIYNVSGGSMTVSGGTVSAIGANGTAIYNYSTGSITVSGGTVSATKANGIAISNISTGKITVGGTAKVTSPATATGEYGTICLLQVPQNDLKTVLDIQGGTVENTAAPEGYSVYFRTSSGVTADNVTDYCRVVSGAKVGRTYPALPIYTVTFEADGGSVSPGSAQTGTDGKLAALPTPVRSDYQFDGWYTTAKDGVKVTIDTVYTQDSTLYAHWTYTGDSGSSDSGSGNSGSGNGSGKGSSTTAQTTTTQTTTQTGDGGSLSTTTTTSTDHSGKKTTVTTEVAKDAAGNVIGSTTTVTTDNIITTQTAQGSAGVTVKPDAAAISSAAGAAGASMGNPMDVYVAVPQETINGEIQKADVNTVQINVVIPNAVAQNPAVQTAGVTVEKETMDAARQTGKNVTVTIREENGSTEAVWSLDGQSMRNAAGQATDLKLGVHTAPVQSEDPTAAPVKSPVTEGGHENGLVITLTAEGTLLAPAKLTVPAAGQTGITAGSTVILYRYDQSTGALSAVPGGIYLVDAGGNVTIDIPAGTRTGAKETYVLLPAVGTGTGAAHMVQRGDTLNQISERYGCSVQELLALNPGVDIYNLPVGGSINVPVR